MRLVTTFLIGMGILVCLVSMAHTGWAGCEQRTVANGVNYFGGNRAAPLSLAPSGLGASCGSGYYTGGYYTAQILYLNPMAGPFSWTNCATENPILWI